jgi:hypothetical protein
VVWSHSVGFADNGGYQEESSAFAQSQCPNRALTLAPILADGDLVRASCLAPRALVRLRP